MTVSRDIPDTIVGSLKSLGLTKYEALVYIALLRVAGATATEIHEVSGVPRASVYPVLDRLVQKELVSVSHTTPRRFDAVPPEEGIGHLMHRIEEDALAARKSLEAISLEKYRMERGGQELIWSIYGQENMKNRLAEILRGAKTHVEMVVSSNLLENTVLPMLSTVPGSVATDIITDRWIGEQPEGITFHVPCRTALCNTVAAQGKSLPYENSGIFLVDDARVLVWMGSAGEAPSALYSESAGFVQFFKRYLGNLREWMAAFRQ
jgi:HTH-type transcriptional regulator, sugar sensing transcriptional regulator